MYKRSDLKLSVIVPVYNAEKYMTPCIESILNQSYNNLEVLLNNDGATDGSPGLCDDFRCADERVKVIHKENEGCSSARNFGINKASGELLAFVDADDRLVLPMYHHLILKTSITGNSPMEKYMTALYGYDIMMAGVKDISQKAYGNMGVQYIWWNLQVFEHLVFQYQTISSNLKRNKKYIKRVSPWCRIKSYAIMRSFDAGKRLILLKRLLKK